MNASLKPKKRLITCSDGTWNEPGNLDGKVVVKTNVEKIHNAIASEGKDGILQVKCYDQGVGTGPGMMSKLIGGATGAGIDKNIKDIYTFLILNFEPGDEIFLFGFSRGAYTARSVAGLIRNCGILKRENLHLLDRAYELYRDRNVYSSPDSDMMIGFKNSFSYTTKIKFIGVWDTVGSLGIPLPFFQLRNKERYNFHDVKLSSQVEYAFQALAIDERRKLFKPAVWQKSNTTLKNPNIQKMEQRWFAGVHSNIGGGYKDSGLSDLALIWLIEKAKLAGIAFEEEKIKDFKPNPLGVLRNSFTPMYWLLGKIWRCINIWENIQPRDPLDIKNTNEVIDDSVWERYNKMKYRPKNICKYLHLNRTTNP